MKEDGSRATMIRMNQAANRMIKMRLLLNSEVFIKEAKYTDAAATPRNLSTANGASINLLPTTATCSATTTTTALKLSSHMLAR